MKNLLIINAGLGGAEGNTHEFLKNQKLPHKIIHLEDIQNFSEIQNQMLEADAILFCTGTYWDSWSHHMQKLLQDMTAIEAHPKILGKPAGVLVTMHSVGGKSVASRLQGVLNTMGFLIPPMSAMVYSLATHIASQTDSEFKDDFWSEEDLQIILHNLKEAAEKTHNYKSWPVDIKDPKRKWLS